MFNVIYELTLKFYAVSFQYHSNCISVLTFLLWFKCKLCWSWTTLEHLHFTPWSFHCTRWHFDVAKYFLSFWIRNWSLSRLISNMICNINTLLFRGSIHHAIGKKYVCKYIGRSTRYWIIILATFSQAQYFQNN